MPKFPLLRMNSDNAVIYYDYGRDLSKPNQGRFTSENRPNNHVNGHFSIAAKKRFSLLIRNWISVIDSIMWIEHNNKKVYNQYITFVTLTLSADQMHSDQEVRRIMLGRFLQQLKRKFHVLTYLYCSEAQKNGRIHFHIIVDRQISWREIRNIWNHIQADNGYIAEFKKKHGHEDPNSTDIHAFRKIRSVAAYMIKYFTKNEERRKVSGRLWGSSDNLKLLHPYRSEIDSLENNVLLYMLQNKMISSYESEHFQIIKHLNYSKMYQINSEFTEKIINHFYSQKSIIYN